jgi:hypothetical protein
MAGPNTTLIQDFLFDGGGNPICVPITFQASQNFISPDGYQIDGKPFVVGTGSDGFLSVSLVPNLGSSPVGTFYNVTYKPSPAGPVTRQTWIIPQSGMPLNIATVNATVPVTGPQTTITQQQILTLLQQYGVTQFQSTSSVNSGHNGIAVVPSGQKGTLRGTVYNPTNSTATVFAEWYDGTNYWRIAGPSTTIPAGGSALLTWEGIIAEGTNGEAFSLNSNTNGLSFVGVYTQFLDSAPARTVKNTSLTSGNTVIYTAPSSAVVAAVGQLGSSGPGVGLTNLSGSTESATLTLISAGVSPLVIAGNSTLANDAAMDFAGPLGMLAGDQLELSLSESGGFAWITVVEF